MTSAAADARAPARWAALVLCGAAVVGGSRWYAATRARPGDPAPTEPAGISAPTPIGLACPADQLPDDGVCIPLPAPEDRAEEAQGAIELLPGRDADPTRYLTPIAAHTAALGRDPLGLFVAARGGAPVTAVALEGQVGPVRRWVTATSPARLLTLHTVERAGTRHHYVLAYDGLSFAPAQGRTEIDVGTPLGRVAARSSGAGLGISVFQLRRGIDPDSVTPERLLLPSVSLACDARNVLPAKPPPQ